MGLRVDEWFWTANEGTLESFEAPAVGDKDCSFPNPSTFDVFFDHFPSLQFPFQRNSQVPFWVFRAAEHLPIQNPATRVDHFYLPLFFFEQVGDEG